MARPPRDVRLASADFRVFLGKSGSGKSHLARHQSMAFRRVIVVDPNGEPAWAESCGTVAHRRAELVEAVRAPGAWRVCWRGVITQGGPEAQVAAWEWANRCALAAGDCLIIWDEVDRYTTAGRLPPHGYTVVNAGRHRGVRAFGLARRPYRLSRDLTGNAGRIMAFRMTEPRDLKWIGETMGEEQARIVPTLADYEAVDWSDSGTVKRRMSPFR